MDVWKPERLENKCQREVPLGSGNGRACGSPRVRRGCRLVQSTVLGTEGGPL